MGRSAWGEFESVGSSPFNGISTKSVSSLLACSMSASNSLHNYSQGVSQMSIQKDSKNVPRQR